MGEDAPPTMGDAAPKPAGDAKADTAEEPVKGEEASAGPKRPSDETILDFFKRYDLDRSGTMNSTNELKQLVTNLVVNLEVPVKVAQIEEKVVAAGNMEENCWDVEQFKLWFFKEFYPDKGSPGSGAVGVSAEKPAEEKPAEEDDGPGVCPAPCCCCAPPGCCVQCCPEMFHEDAADNHVLKASRWCTDFPFLALFICFNIGMVVVMGLAFDKGDPNRLMYGSDWRGEPCNSNDLKGYKNQFWPNPLYYKFIGSMCLDKCPTTMGQNDATGLMEVMCVCNGQLAEGNQYLDGFTRGSNIVNSKDGPIPTPTPT